MVGGFLMVMLAFTSACSSKSADDNVWDHYTARDEVADGQYIDNDAYYSAPTGGYVNGANGGIIDAD